MLGISHLQTTVFENYSKVSFHNYTFQANSFQSNMFELFAPKISIWPFLVVVVIFKYCSAIKIQIVLWIFFTLLFFQNMPYVLCFKGTKRSKWFTWRLWISFEVWCLKSIEHEVFLPYTFLHFNCIWSKM